MYLIMWLYSRYNKTFSHFLGNFSWETAWGVKQLHFLLQPCSTKHNFLMDKYFQHRKKAEMLGISCPKQFREPTYLLLEPIPM